MPEFTMTEPDLEDDYTDDVPADAAAPAVDDAPSGLAALSKALQAAVDKPERFPIPRLTGWSLECRVDIGIPALERLRKQAKTDTALFDRLLIVAVTAGIYDGRKLVVDDQSDAVTFTSDAMLTMTGAASAAGAVKAFIGRDGDISALASAIVSASGYGQPVESDGVADVNPTGSGA